MKKTHFIILIISLLFAQNGLTQAFTNGEVDGIVGLPSLPPSWTDVPDTDPNSLALAPIQATVDVLDGLGPNQPGGIAGVPFSGTTCVSGLQATDGGASYWHEGIQQTVNGFTPGNSYTICFYQAVIKQMNCIDETGSWAVYFDNTLAGISAPTTSLLPFDDVNVTWELRSVTFTATAASHVIKFLPSDDDANAQNDPADNTGGLRMGIDLISFGPPPADPTITPVGPFCLGDPALTLTAVDGGGTWTGTGITNGATGDFDPAVAGIGSHTITYTLTSGCAGTVADSIVIDITNTADASWTSPGAICEADGPIDLSLLITGTAGGSWMGTGVSGNTFDPTGLSGPISVTYSVGTAPCDDSNNQNITVVTNPDPTWVPPTGLCTTSPLVDLNTLVTGTAGGTWSGTGVTGNNFDPAAGTQTVTYTVGSGSCQQTLALPITIGTSADASWTTVTLCISDAPVDLNNTITGDLGGTWSGTGITGSTFDPSVGTQSITYTVGAGSCQDMVTQTITVVDPQLSTTTVDISCNGLTDGSATVTATGVSGSETYSWSTVPAQNTATATGLAAGTYTVTVLDGTCSATATVTINEPSPITATIVGTDGCGTPFGSALVTASGGSGGYTYAWNNSSNTTNNPTDLDSNMHTVTITDGSGCTYQDSVLITIWPAPVISLINDTTIIYGDCINLDASGGFQYSWTPDTDLDCNDCPNPSACPTTLTTYCVTGYDINGCQATECVTVDVEIICGEVFVPSAFSPNNDGENDVLCVYSDCIQTMSMRIYNRWGELVFESNNPLVCWDGNWKGKELNSAVFAYILEGTLINGQQIDQKGNISLVR